MDYSSYYTAPQSYQFLGLPPTPIHTESGGSVDEFGNSPSVRGPSFHYVASPRAHDFPHYQSNERTQAPFTQRAPLHPSYYVQQHYSPVSPVQRSSSTSFSASPVHPNYIVQSFLTQNHQQDVYDQFQTFDFNPQFHASNQHVQKSITPVQQLQHQQQQQKPQAQAQHKSSIGTNGHGMGMSDFGVTKFEPNTYSNEAALDDTRNVGQQGGSNSDDDDMTPAQSRRKAQNRAAQRAFRERKERHVKDLEIKLQALENASKNLTSENERLKIQLQKASTENEILKATSGSHRSESPPTTAGPMQFSPTDFYSEVLQSHDNKTPSHRIVFGDDGGRLLAAGAAWDYIISHPLFLKGMVDVGDVSERLKTQARCDGQGPVFSENDIVKAIEASVASGNDELL